MKSFHAAYFAALFVGIPLAVILGLTAILLAHTGDVSQ